MKKSTVFLTLACIFAIFFIINIVAVFNWSDTSWESNKGAYLTTFSNGLLFASQLFLYIDTKKKENNAK